MEKKKSRRGKYEKERGEQPEKTGIGKEREWEEWGKRNETSNTKSNQTEKERMRKEEKRIWGTICKDLSSYQF